MHSLFTFYRVLVWALIHTISTITLPAYLSWKEESWYQIIIKEIKNIMTCCFNCSWILVWSSKWEWYAHVLAIIFTIFQDLKYNRSFSLCLSIKYTISNFHLYDYCTFININNLKKIYRQINIVHFPFTIEKETQRDTEYCTGVQLNNFYSDETSIIH